MIISRSALLALVLSPALSFAGTYYVRPSGGSYGLENGTSYANAFDGFSAAITGVSNGDTLYVCGTHNEQLTVSKSITVDFRCQESGVINRGNANGSRGIAYSSGGEGAAILYPRITNVDDYGVIADSGSATTYVGWTITGGEIDTCTDTAQTCIRFVGAGITVNGVTIHDCYTDCIWGQGSGATVINNNIYNVAMSGQNAGDGIQLSSIVNNAVIRNNIINHDDYDSKYCIIATGTGKLRIEGNTCVRGSGYTTGSGIYTETSADILGNRITGGNYNILCALQNSAFECNIAGNIGTGATTSSVVLGSLSTGAKVYNNDFSDQEIDIVNTGVVDVRNNIIRNSSFGITAPAGSSRIENYNLFISVTTPSTINGVSQSIGANSIIGVESQALSAGTYVYPSVGINGYCQDSPRNIGTLCGSSVPYGYSFKPKKRR